MIYESECCDLVQNSTYQSSPYVGFCTRSQHLLSYFDDRDKALKYHEPLTSRNRSPFKWRHHQHHHNRIHLSSYQRRNHLLIRTMVVSHIVVIIVRMGVTKMMMLRFDIMEQRRRLRLHIIAMMMTMTMMTAVWRLIQKNAHKNMMREMMRSYYGR